MSARPVGKRLFFLLERGKPVLVKDAANRHYQIIHYSPDDGSILALHSASRGPDANLTPLKIEDQMVISNDEIVLTVKISALDPTYSRGLIGVYFTISR